MKKYSRTEVAKMSPAEFAAAARGPYGKLLAYLRPYRARFIIGLICGAVYGGLNGLLVYTVHQVTDKVLPPEEKAGLNGSHVTETWHEDRELPELRDVLAAKELPAADQAAALKAYVAFRKAVHERTLVPAPTDPLTDPLLKLTLPPALPAEFRLFLEAERHLVVHPPSTSKARKALDELLALPEAERRHRTTWAHYLSAKLASDRLAKTAEFDALKATAATPGFTDVISLASTVPMSQPLQMIIIVCASIPGLMLLRAVFGYLNSYCLVWVSLKLLDNIRGDLFGKILQQSQEFFNKQKGGDLLQTIMNQTRVAQQGFTGVISDLVKQPLSILSALAVLFYLDWKFTLMAMLLFPLCIIPVMLVSKKVRKAGAEEESEAGAMGVIMQEAFSGIRVVKAYGREEYETSRFNSSNQKMLRSMMRWNRALEGVGPLTEVVASL
ncbi:MAG: msbA, partial [Verrucomicrobiales bacterium]|nr:msbA [Verrucomicrobiales bacterium]